MYVRHHMKSTGNKESVTIYRFKDTQTTGVYVKGLTVMAVHLFYMHLAAERDSEELLSPIPMD